MAPAQLRPSATRVVLPLAGALIAVMALSLLVGRYPRSFFTSPSLLAHDELARRVILTLRLPRALTAMLLGMTLAGAGTVMQMIFRNPIVEPGFLGVSQGAAFGAALGILTGGAAISPLVTEVSASAFALLGLALTYFMARRLRFGGWVLRLVLAGIAVSALFASGIGILKYMADPLTQLPAITFWMMGGLAGITWHDFLYVVPFAVPGLLLVLLMRWRLNVLALDDATAFSLGTAPGRERALLLVGAVVATAAVTSVSGVVGWVGLIVPHLARRLYGADTRLTVPAAMLLGGIFTVVCDDLARTLLAGELPLGILTSLIGAFVFLILMSRTRIRVGT
jgi:iron complex transport system permease protein